MVVVRRTLNAISLGSIPSTRAHLDMAMMRRLALLRHKQSDFDTTESICYYGLIGGQVDVGWLHLS